MRNGLRRSGGGANDMRKEVLRIDSRETRLFVGSLSWDVYLSAFASCVGGAMFVNWVGDH